jgi:hypothetical protein
MAVPVGVSGRVIDPKNQAVIANIKVNAQIVVAAAGAIQTPLLLQRSKLPNKNNQLGRNLSLHPTGVGVRKIPCPLYMVGVVLSRACTLTNF